MPTEPKTLKNIITNICAIAILAVGALKVALDAQAGADINWFAAISAVAVALIGYFTGKPNNA
jgi:hypothetical protein